MESSPTLSSFRKTVDSFESDSMTLAGHYYASDGIFDTELERIFYEQWICVGHGGQVADAGDCIVVKVGGESLLVLRDREGELRAFYNVCRHRGTVLRGQADERSADCIHCPYHGWTYDLKGNLIRAPLMEEVASFKKADYPLHSVAIHMWEGFLFINLAMLPKPFVSVFGPLAGKFLRWQLSELRVARSVEYDVRANWKLIIENYLECYHCPIIHPEFVRNIPYRSGRNDLFEGPFLGGYMEMKPGVESLTRSRRRCSPILDNVSGEDLRRIYFYSIFPNMTLSLHPDYVMAFTLWPIDCRRTRVNCEWLFASEALARGECDPDDAVQFWDNANKEDWQICGLVQEGVGSRRYSPSPYSNTESLPAAFDREVLSALSPR
jgi:Rieske 2Fe-2S family protein